jgi:uncharacterized membrane protein
VIAEEETKSRGEIRVTVHGKRSWLERKRTVRDLALREFRRLGIHRTAERNGVLLFLIVRSREFRILADEGIHMKVPGGTWAALAGRMTEEFKEGRFFEGIEKALREVGRFLAEHYPPGALDRNELPDDVVLS